MIVEWVHMLVIIVNAVMRHMGRKRRMGRRRMDVSESGVNFKNGKSRKNYYNFMNTCFIIIC